MVFDLKVVKTFILETFAGENTIKPMVLQVTFQSGLESHYFKMPLKVPLKNASKEFFKRVLQKNPLKESFKRIL